jgi:uncharacterized protein
MINDDLLDILACPLCEPRPPFRLQGAYLVCTECGFGFPIRDGIPRLLPEDGIAPEQLKELLDGNE